MSRIPFYLRYAARNLSRNLRWTLFAVFSIAAGVAAIVALRSLGLAIGDSLVGSARDSIRGDITITAPGFGGTFGAFGGSNRDRDILAQNVIDTVTRRANELGGQVSAYSVFANLQITAVDAVTVGRPQFVTTILIDPLTFPPTGDILAQEPAGAPLRTLFKGNSIVISRNLADQQGLGVGDTVRISGTDEVFTVTGIVATEQEAGLRNLFASFFGFAYIDIAQADRLGLNPQPNAISITVPEGTDIPALAAEFAPFVRGGDMETVTEVLEENTIISDVIGRFIVIMGLGALLIGGIGIINTMLVMVGRRTMEIAAMKTFGLKGGQVGSLFLAEAFLLGVMGSIVGCVLGVLLSGAVNAYGEAFLQQRLPWRIYPEAFVYGIGLGMVVTMVFGLLPVLTANRIRPAIILRPNEAQIPGTSIFHAFLDDPDVRLVGLEAGGDGVDTGRHAATISGGAPGVLHGARSFLLQDEDGQTIESHSISAGLDYPGVGPEHAWLASIGRAEYRPITDAQAMEAFRLLCRTEGIIPAIESAHALAGAMQLGQEAVAAGAQDTIILVNLSGRGDKDVETAAEWFALLDEGAQ